MSGMNELQGCRVMVSAGASGIGLTIARAFLAAGARVEVCDVSDDALRQAGDEPGGLGTHRADVSDAGAVDRWFDKALGALGGLDVLVNNAGVAGPTGALEDLSEEDWDRTMSVNVRGHFLCTRRAIPALKQSGRAAIINISSVAGRLGYPFRTPYAASKWAVIGMTQSLAIELGPHDITVNAILPGIVESRRVTEVLASKARLQGVTEDALRAEVLEHVALNRMVPMAHIADTALFLASPAGRSITGQNMNVCAGVRALR